MSVENVCLTVNNRMYSTAGVVNQFECEHNHFTDCLRAIFGHYYSNKQTFNYSIEAFVA